MNAAPFNGETARQAPARILVTGAAGFIGFHVAQRLLSQGATVVGVDNFCDYYDVGLKRARAAELARQARFTMVEADVADKAALEAAWRACDPEVVIHLAAQAGVRYSVEHPELYISANIVGTFHVLELARHRPLQHLMCASTSSVYGANTVMPFSEIDRAVHPLSLYAASKASTELIGHAYAHLFQIPMTFFRFFTVYGPWSRPDMAPIKFAKAIFAGEPIDVYNHGEMQRDFTYVSDLVDALVRLMGAAPVASRAAHDSLSPVAPHRVVNIGAGAPVVLNDFIAELERAIGRAALRNNLPIQPGDVLATEASLASLTDLIGPVQRTPLSQGVRAFVDWYRAYYKV